MHVIRASALGLCFGVRDALKMAHGIEDATDVTVHGELVHNPLVLVQLQQQGFQMLAESERNQTPATPRVLVTAHGISDRERTRLTEDGKQLIDTTCPLVRRAHEAAQRLAREGCYVLVIGRPGHVEVRGIVDDLAECAVIARVEDVCTLPQARLGIVCQTTTPPRQADEIVAAIRSHNPQAEVRFVNTICQPTLDRQRALEELCRVVDAVVVVGGANSNNTRQLVALARELGTPAWQVQSADELCGEWFTNCRTVGLTAGTSTLDQTVEEVEQALAAMDGDSQTEEFPLSPAKSIISTLGMNRGRGPG
jgi:4-hydroxy-3-methylbut-2-en-1-yl diphosphate reductase